MTQLPIETDLHSRSAEATPRHDWTSRYNMTAKTVRKASAEDSGLAVRTNEFPRDDQSILGLVCEAQALIVNMQGFLHVSDSEGTADLARMITRVFENLQRIKDHARATEAIKALTVEEIILQIDELAVRASEDIKDNETKTESWTEIVNQVTMLLDLLRRKLLESIPEYDDKFGFLTFKNCLIQVALIQTIFSRRASFQYQQIVPTLNILEFQSQMLTSHQ